MQYAIITSGIVTGVVNSNKKTAEIKKLYGADEVRSVGDDFNFYGDARAIDWTTQTVKSLSQLVSEGLVTVPEGAVLDGETIRQMTRVERIEAGLDTLPVGWKITGGELVSMTRDERYDAGQITAAQYNDEVRQERHWRYVAESDPLYLEYVYDAEVGRDTAPVKKQAWIAKIDEIKAALPLKGE